jgi:hypothetical protein
MDRPLSALPPVHHPIFPTAQLAKDLALVLAARSPVCAGPASGRAVWRAIQGLRQASSTVCPAAGHPVRFHGTVIVMSCGCNTHCAVSSVLQPEGGNAMFSYILQKAQQFQREFGVAPTVIYINPRHFEALFRESPELFSPDMAVRLGFKLVILPSSRLAHPEAALLMQGAAGRIEALPVAETAPALTAAGDRHVA